MNAMISNAHLSEQHYHLERPPLDRIDAVFFLSLFGTLSAVYVILIIAIDNTNLATTNGLWKSAYIFRWATNGQGWFDTGGVLYLPIYFYITAALPDSWFHYGEYGQFLIYRKMAVTNALFGALSTAGVYLLSRLVLVRRLSALVVAVSHAALAFVMLNSLNSEDVIPAYAFFIFSVFAFFAFVRHRNYMWLAVSTFCIVMVTFFHWTLLFPVAFALGSTIFWLSMTDRRYAWAIPAAPLLYLSWLFAVTMIIVVVKPEATVFNLRWLLFPAKAGGTGWTGFHVDKVYHALAGMGQYFFGGRNITNFVTVSANPFWLTEVTAGLVLLLAALAVCVITVLAESRGKEKFFAVALAIFGACFFLSGELMHLYSQPQDPQSQIQPMFVGIIGLMLGLRYVEAKYSTKFTAIITAISLFFAGSGFYNASQFLSQRGMDSQAIIQLQQFSKIFPADKTVIVTHGFEGWNTWRFVEGFRADRTAFDGRSIFVSTPFIRVQYVSAIDAASHVTATLERAFAAGDDVVACAMWTESEDRFVASMSTVTTNERARSFYRIMRERFETAKSWDTPYGRCVTLVLARDDV